MTAKTTLPRETFKNIIGKLIECLSLYILTCFCFKNRYNDPEKLVQKDVNKSDPPAKENKLSYLQSYLSSMKSGTKVFSHFLANSNLSQIFDGKITIFLLNLSLH
jgi:hypothetical protein